MRTSHGIAAAFLLLGAPSGFASPAEQQLAEQYCTLYNNRKLDKQYAGLLSPALAGKLREAIEKNHAYEQRHPGNKPPLGDGIPFTTFSDHASCRTGKLLRSRGRTRIEVIYRINGVQQGRDRLLLAQEDGAWKIDDILYGPGNYYRSLRLHLQGVFAP